MLLGHLGVLYRSDWLSIQSFMSHIHKHMHVTTAPGSRSVTFMQRCTLRSNSYTHTSTKSAPTSHIMACSSTLITTIILLMLRPQQVAAQIHNPLHPYCPCRAPSAAGSIPISYHSYLSSYVVIDFNIPSSSLSISTRDLARLSDAHQSIRNCTFHVPHPTHL